MKIAILGYDVEGKASYDYFKDTGHEITICDQNPDLIVPENTAAQLGPDYLENLDKFEVLIRTPGLQPTKVIARNPGVESKITTATNLFFENTPTQNIIGVTGTKGKGTTSSLITKILEAAGKKVFLGGNIGVPALSFLPEVQPNDWVVLELSSFQCTDLHYSPAIAVCLMVVPEHLNWHKDFENYLLAKSQLFIHQTAENVMVFNADNENSVRLADLSPAHKLRFSTKPDSPEFGTGNTGPRGAYIHQDHIYMDQIEICSVDKIALLGAHNWQNVCAAICATWDAIGQNDKVILSVITSFKGLEHRLELVRTLNGVDYYDDSFGTTPETATVAIQAFTEPKIVILGGSDKGATFDELAITVKNADVKHCLLIGDTAPVIENALRTVGYADYSAGGKTMVEIVAKAQSIATIGDVVLLSTGCASFDMFANYKDRGTQFQQAVNALN